MTEHALQTLLYCHACLSGPGFLSIVGVADRLAQAVLQLSAVHDDLLCVYGLDSLERHRANPSCASCHSVMDPIGFSLENYDLIGKWRDADSGMPVNAAGRLVDGTMLDGAASLRHALLDRREAVVATAAEKLLTYALGRRVEYFDMPAVRVIVRDAARNEYRFSSLVAGVVKSLPFQMKRYEGGTEP